MEQSQPPRRPRQTRAQAEQRRKRLRRRRQLQLLTLGAVALLILVLILTLSKCGADKPAATEEDTSTQTTAMALPVISWMTFPEDRVLTAKQYFVYDCLEQTFLVISEDPDARIYPASITKLFTAYVAAQYLQADQLVTAGEALNLVAAGSSVAELKKGDTLTVRQLIGGMILPSGNDAANVLAAEAGRNLLGDPNADATTAVNAFVDHMNGEAVTLGMTGTHFANPDGIHRENHYTTYRDLVIMATLSLNNSSVLDYCATGEETVTVASDRQLQWHNTNLLVVPDSDYYCPYAIGLKTGQTPYAGSCLLSAFDMGDRTLIIGVFGCPDIPSRFEDTLQLLNEVMAQLYPPEA